MSVTFRASSWHINDNVVTIQGISSVGKKIRIFTKYHPYILLRVVDSEINKLQLYLSSVVPIHSVHVYDDDKFIKVPYPEISDRLMESYTSSLVAVSVQNMYHYKKLKMLIEKSRDLEMIGIDVPHLTRYLVFHGLTPGDNMFANHTKNLDLTTDDELVISAQKITTYKSCEHRPLLNHKVAFIVSTRKGHLLHPASDFYDNAREDSVFYETEDELKLAAENYSFCVTDSLDLTPVPEIPNGIDVNKVLYFTEDSWNNYINTHLRPVRLTSTSDVSSDSKSSDVEADSKSDEDSAEKVLKDASERADFNLRLLQRRDYVRIISKLQNFWFADVRTLDEKTLPELVENIAVFNGLYEKYSKVKLPKFNKKFQGMLHCTKTGNLLYRWISEDDHNINVVNLMDDYPCESNISAAFWESGFCKLNENSLWNILEDVVKPNRELSEEDEFDEAFVPTPPIYHEGEFYSTKYESQRDRIAHLKNHILYFNEDVLITVLDTNFSIPMNGVVTDIGAVLPDLRPIGWYLDFHPMTKENGILQFTMHKSDLEYVIYPLNKNLSISVKDRIAYLLKARGYVPDREFFGVKYCLTKSNLGLQIEPNFSMYEDLESVMEDTLYYDFGI